MRRLSVLVLCAVCFALPLSTGCGGGDDPKPDAGTPPPPPPPPDGGAPDAGPKPDAGPVDLLPPTLLTNSPGDQATAVRPETPIELTFSEEMKLDRGSLQIIPSTGFPNNGIITPRPQDWDASKKKVTFTFPDGLPLKAKLTVNVSNFADAAGNPMRGVFTFAFTVGDGEPPSVASSSPAEGAASVPITTNKVSITFSEAMDTTVGTLTPSGLTLGPATWSLDATKIEAPITSSLAYDVNYSVKLTGFRNIIGKAFDGTKTLGDGKLDFGTGLDKTPPTVVDSSPREGATGVRIEDTSLLVVTFSEPMEANPPGAKTELVDGSIRTVLTPVWSSDGFNATYDVQFKLRAGVKQSVVFTGFKDRQGNALNVTPYLGGALDFTTAPDTTRPWVISSIPAEGEEIYPVEVYTTGGSPPTDLRKVFTFQFSEPMDSATSHVTLRETYNANAYQDLYGKWSADGRTLTVTVKPQTPGQLPLQSDYFYFMDLTELKDRAGNPLDVTLPVLGNGKLEFQTVTDFPLLDHACEHALLQTVPTGVTTTATFTASTPRADQLHTRYELTLVSNGTSFAGYTRAQLQADTTHYVFMDRDVHLTVIDPAFPSQPLVVNYQAVRSACAPITHVASFGTTTSPEFQIRYGPFPESKFRAILETRWY